MMPAWHPQNLADHFLTRLENDPQCLVDLFDCAIDQITIKHYEDRSIDVYYKPTLEYECESWDTNNRCYRARAAYYVDKDLVVAITTFDRTAYITCYHEHFNRKHNDDYVQNLMAKPPGNRIMEMKQKITDDERGRVIINVTWRRP
jgi:hypothetical protein